jgi:PASTA domain
MSRTQAESDLDAMVHTYLRELEHALATLEPNHRAQLIQEIEQHVAELRSEQVVQSPSEMKNLLDRVGDPVDIAAAALEDEDGEQKSKSRTTGKTALIAAGVAILVAVVLFVTLGSSTHHVPPAKGRGAAQAAIKHTVPNVIGMSQAQAEVTLQAAGFSLLETHGVPSLQVPLGMVIAQSPPAGQLVQMGSKVSLSISSGPPAGATVTVLSVVGQSQAQAVSELASLGLNDEIHTVPSSSVPIGLVISTSPSAGSTVPSGSTISVTVSAGAASPG